jgi:hypothetical protein
VLSLVKKKGISGNWTIDAEEGMHFLTASIIRTLACKLDTVNGFILTDTIDASHFVESFVGIATDIEGYVL